MWCSFLHIRTSFSSCIRMSYSFFNTSYVKAFTRWSVFSCSRLRFVQILIRCWRFRWVFFVETVGSFHSCKFSSFKFSNFQLVSYRFYRSLRQGEILWCIARLLCHVMSSWLLISLNFQGGSHGMCINGCYNLEFTSSFSIFCSSTTFLSTSPLHTSPVKFSNSPDYSSVVDLATKAAADDLVT